MSDPNSAPGGRPLSKHPHNGAMPSIGIFVTAPHGIGEIGRLMAALKSQLEPPDRLVVLDGKAYGPDLDSVSPPAAEGIELIRDAGESAMHMRRNIGTMADTDVIVLLEDHAIPGPRFFATVRELFAANSSLVAVKLLGRNDISVNHWGWANFLMAFADCLHPAHAMPKAMLSTSAAIRASALPARQLELGEWETVVFPALSRDPERLVYSNDIYIDHFESCRAKESLFGNFHNQRSLAFVRVAQGHRRGKLAVRAFKDLGLRRHRQIARALEGREEYRHVAANRGKLIALGWAGTLGAIAGAYFGAGSSMRKMH